MLEEGPSLPLKLLSGNETFGLSSPSDILKLARLSNIVGFRGLDDNVLLLLLGFLDIEWFAICNRRLLNYDVTIIDLTKAFPE